YGEGVVEGSSSNAGAGGSITTDLRALGLERRWVQVGYANQDQEYLAGGVDEVQIYNRALSGTEIGALANAGTSSATQVSLSSAFNRVGIVNDGSTFGTGLDGGGSALSANLLGSSVTWNNSTFSLGAPNSNDVVSASGQTLSLPAGSFAALNFLATGVGGNQPNQTFTVTYTDGTTQTFTQSISDWYTPQNYSGESTAATMAYRDKNNGTKDIYSPFYIYGYSLALNSGKTVQSLTLPNDSNVEILAVTLTGTGVLVPTVPENP